jgi:thymidylate synthase (FAD)
MKEESPVYKVQLLHHAPLSLAVTAIRRCYLSEGKSDSIHHSEAYYELGRKDRALIERVLRDNHLSTLEHLTYTFDLTFSRAVLQEWSRHRIASESVQSTRYTLGVIKDKAECEPDALCGEPGCTSMPFLKSVLPEIDTANCQQLCKLQDLLQQGHPNDKVKYGIPEAFLTSLIWTINARSLRNFLSLRSSNRALWEMQELAGKVFAALPEDHQFIFADCMEDA